MVMPLRIWQWILLDCKSLLRQFSCVQRSSFVFLTGERSDQVYSVPHETIDFLNVKLSILGIDHFANICFTQ